MEINPAILTADIGQFEKQLALVKEYSDTQAIQVDIIDPYFADNITLTPTDLALANLDFSQIELDFHLMTEEPMDFVWELIEHQKDLPVRAVYGQIEKMSYQNQFLEEVKKHDWHAGLALNLYTPVESIEDDAWEWLDAVLLMAVEAGAQGQKFNDLVFAKIKELQSKAKEMGRVIKISIDGGVKAEQLAQLKDLNIDQVAIGSALFNADDFASAINQLNEEV